MTSLSLLLALTPQAALTGPSVLAPDAHLTTPVAGLERTGSTANVVAASGHGFTKALRVVIGQDSAETNATQLTLSNNAIVREGHAMLATVWLRGQRTAGKARAELLFEKATSPWTKSITQGLALTNDWKEFDIPFRAAENYDVGEAMLSLRLAFGPQTVEIGNVSLTDLGRRDSLEPLIQMAAARQPIGKVDVTLDLKHPRQTMIGFGGNFCQPRYGSTEPLDVVGKYALANLRVAHARIGLPLEKWVPERGIYHDDAQAKASLQALAEMNRRKIPTVLSIWEGPQWMLGGRPEQSGRVLDPVKYDVCIDAIAAYLVLARDKYGTVADYLSFNEPDYGVNFKFTPETMRNFIRRAGPKFATLNLKTKFVVGDTAGGSSAAAYDAKILSDPTIAPYLGPIAFHCWDVLSAADESYVAIANLGAKFKKPVWCLEAGHDSQLWQAKDPWNTWDNALRTAMAYERTLRLARPAIMDYWTYQDNYPLVDKTGPKPYSVFRIIQQMEKIFSAGSKVITAPSTSADLQSLATLGPKGRIGILLINTQGNGTVRIRGLKPGARASATANTNGFLGVTTTSKVDAKGVLTVATPTRSVVIAQIEPLGRG